MKEATLEIAAVQAQTELESITLRLESDHIMMLWMEMLFLVVRHAQLFLPFGNERLHPSICTVKANMCCTCPYVKVISIDSQKCNF